MTGQSELKLVNGLDFNELSRPNWFHSPEKSSIRLFFYNCMGLDQDTSLDLFKKVIEGTEFSPSVLINLIVGKEFELDTLTFNSATPQPHVLTQGMTQEKKKFFPPLFLVSTPSCVDGAEVSLKSQVEVSEANVALCRAVLGRNFMYEKVHEMVLAEGGSKIVLRSPRICIDHMIDGPYFLPNTLAILNDCMSMIETKKWSPNISKSIHFFNKAFEPPDQFINYWIALEILCGGSKTKMEKVIKHALEVNKDKVLKVYGLSKMEQTRNDFFHKGVVHEPPAPFLRYMYYLYIDVLCHVLGREVRHLSTAVLKRGEIRFSKKLSDYEEELSSS